LNTLRGIVKEISLSMNCLVLARRASAPGTTAQLEKKKKEKEKSQT
jgi:hypothetical protein